MQDFIVSVYPLKEKKFLVSFLHPLTKRRIREHFDTKDKALEFKSQTENKFKKNRVENYLELNVEALLILFMQENTKSDFAKSKIYLIDFIETFGKFNVEELTADVLKTWLDQIQRENNLKDITMRGIKCSVDVFFKYLIKKEVISESPLTTVFYKKTVRDVQSRNILSKAKIAELLEKIKAFSPGYLYPIIKTITETAAKPSEIVDLTWKQIDLENKEIFFPKTDCAQERKIKISDELILHFEKTKKTTGLVFLTYYKEPFTKNKLRRLTIEFKVKTGCKLIWNPMDLRHSFAVNYLLNNGDIKKLQYILGHQSIHDTRRLYTEVLNKKMKSNDFSVPEIGS